MMDTSATNLQPTEEEEVMLFGMDGDATMTILILVMKNRGLCGIIYVVQDFILFDVVFVHLTVLVE